MNQALLDTRAGSPKQHAPAAPAPTAAERQKSMEEAATRLLEVGLSVDAVCRATSLSGRCVADLQWRIERGGEEDG
ncbi:MAG: hypothetical protein AAF471_07110 [Myxococcota bacterium]